MHIYIILLSVLLVFSGCISRKSIPAKYYIIDYPADIQLNTDKTGEPIQKSCLIDAVEIYPAYSTNQIALRENTHEIRYFVFNQWAVRPEQSFEAIITNFIKDHNIFKSISSTAIDPEPDYIIETTVYHLELIKEDNDYHAHLNLVFSLKDGRTEQKILNHNADKKILLEDKDLNIFASTVSRIFIEELAVFTNSVSTDLR